MIRTPYPSDTTEEKGGILHYFSNVVIINIIGTQARNWLDTGLRIIQSHRVDQRLLCMYGNTLN